MCTVSIVTVCYNALNNLRKTIESSLRQTLPDVEFVIIDGASSDGTVDYLKGITDSRVRWISEKDDGIFDAMNKGVRMARGEWVIFMNAADTFASEDTLQQVFTNAGVASADIIYGDVIKNGKVKEAEPPHNAHRMFFCHQCAFVRTALQLQVPFDTKYRMSADFKFFKTMIRQKRQFVQLHFPIANFDTQGVSNTRRSAGILENIKIVKEVDNLSSKIRLLPRLSFQYLACKLRGR